MNAPERYAAWRYEDEDEQPKVVYEPGEWSVRSFFTIHFFSQNVICVFDFASMSLLRLLLRLLFVLLKSSALADTKLPNSGMFILGKEDHTAGALIRT